MMHDRYTSIDTCTVLQNARSLEGQLSSCSVLPERPAVHYKRWLPLFCASPSKETAQVRSKKCHLRPKLTRRASPRNTEPLPAVILDSRSQTTYTLEYRQRNQSFRCNMAPVVNRPHR